MLLLSEKGLTSASSLLASASRLLLDISGLLVEEFLASASSLL